MCTLHASLAPLDAHEGGARDDGTTSSYEGAGGTTSSYEGGPFLNKGIASADAAAGVLAAERAEMDKMRRGNHTDSVVHDLSNVDSKGLSVSRDSARRAAELSEARLEGGSDAFAMHDALADAAKATGDGGNGSKASAVLREDGEPSTVAAFECTRSAKAGPAGKPVKKLVESSSKAWADIADDSSQDNGCNTSARFEKEGTPVEKHVKACGVPMAMTEKSDELVEAAESTLRLASGKLHIQLSIKPEYGDDFTVEVVASSTVDELLELVVPQLTEHARREVWCHDSLAGVLSRDELSGFPLSELGLRHGSMIMISMWTQDELSNEEPVGVSRRRRRRKKR